MRHIFQRLLPRRLWLAGLPCLALLGCVQNHNKPAIDTPAEEKIPVYQLADYLSTECSDIWALQGKSTETNPLYWLRAMDCADRLMPAQSRQQARQYDDGSWQNTFKQGILLADAKITPYERRQLVARIEALSTGSRHRFAHCINSGAMVRRCNCNWRKSANVTVNSSSPATASWIHCASNITFYSSNWNSPPASWKT